MFGNRCYLLVVTLREIKMRSLLSTAAQFINIEIYRKQISKGGGSHAGCIKRKTKKHVSDTKKLRVSPVQLFCNEEELSGRRTTRFL